MRGNITVAAERQSASSRSAAEPERPRKTRSDSVLRMSPPGGARLAQLAALANGKPAVGPVVQRTKKEADQLIDSGRTWNREIWVKAQNSTDLAAMMNAKFEEMGFTVRRGWQPYDPVVRGKGATAKSYGTLMQNIAKKGGAKQAKLFLKWMTDDSTTFDMLPEELRELAAITHFAEVGRGYEAALGDLKSFLESVANGEATASKADLNAAFAPSLTYKQDSFEKIGEYKPMSDDESDTESDGEISDDEAMEMSAEGATKESKKRRGKLRSGKVRTDTSGTS